MKLELQTRMIEGITVLTCKGRLAYREEAVAFSEAVAGLLSPGQPLVIALGDLEMVDSAGLGELVVVHMWARAIGSPLKLAAANARIVELFELTNLLSVFELHATVEEALSCLRQGKNTAAASAA